MASEGDYVLSRLPVPLSKSSGRRSTSPRVSKIPRSPNPPHVKTTSIAPCERAKSAGRAVIPRSPRPTAQMTTSSAVGCTLQSKTTDRPAMSSYHPHYISAHMGEPCTLGALDHHLTCGHKIMTGQPETCARNCGQPQLPSQHANPRSIDQAFVCMSCITQQLKKEHAEKVSSFCAELQLVAKATWKTDAAAWIADKIRIVEIAWRDLEIERLMTRAAGSRFCHAMYVDEDYQELISVAVSNLHYRRDQRQARSAMPATKASQHEQDGGSESTSTKRSRSPCSSAPPSPSTSDSSVRSASRLPVPRKRLMKISQ